MKKHVILAVLMLCLAFSNALSKEYDIKDIPNVQLQDSTRLFSDPENIVSPQMTTRIDSALLAIRRETSCEVVAVIVPGIPTSDDEWFATELFNQWGIGKKDKNNGVLIFVNRDGHAATIRDGAGAEGVVTDFLSDHIIHDVMIPYFKDGDYGAGILAGVNELGTALRDPTAVDELMSKHKAQDEEEFTDFLTNYLKTGVGAFLILLCVIAYILYRTRNMTDYDKYKTAGKYQLFMWVVTALFLGVPILAPLLLNYLRKKWRDNPKTCPNCHTKMQKLDEEADNEYLTAAQDAEEKLDSVDYDVWLCPNCGETDIYAFENTSKQYTKCPRCGARAMALSGCREIVKPTCRSEGQGEKIYTCRYCNHQERKKYTIPRKEDPEAIAVAAGLAARGRGSGSGGGGFGGGGFGGGFSGGGGATGRW